MLKDYCIDCDKCRNIRRCPSDIFRVPDGPSQPNGWPMPDAMKTWLRTDSEYTADESGPDCEHGCHSDCEDPGDVSGRQAGASTPALSHSGSSLCTLDLSLALDATLRTDSPSDDENKNTAARNFHDYELQGYRLSLPDFQDDYAEHFAQVSDDAELYQAAQQQEHQHSLGQTVMQTTDQSTVTPNRESQPAQRRKAFLNFTNTVAKGVRKRLATSIANRRSQKQPEPEVATPLQISSNQEPAAPDSFVKKRRLNDMGENTHTADELHDIRGLSTYEHGVVSGTMTQEELEAMHLYYSGVSSPSLLPKTQEAMSFLEEVARDGSPEGQAGAGADVPHFLNAQPDEHAFDYDPFVKRDDFIQKLKANFDEVVDQKDRLIIAQQNMLSELCNSSNRQSAMIAELQGKIAKMQEEAYHNSIRSAAPATVHGSSSGAPASRARSASPIHEKSAVQQDATAEFSPVKRGQAPILQPTVFEGMKECRRRYQGPPRSQFEAYAQKYRYPCSSSTRREQ